MLRHIACTDTLQVNTRYAEINLRIYGPQVVTAAQTLAMHPQSKIAREHMEGVWFTCARRPRSSRCRFDVVFGRHSVIKDP